MSEEIKKTDRDSKVKKGFSIFNENLKMRNFSTYASSISFFFFLSLIPMLVLISSLLPMTGITKENMVSAITSVTPDVVNGLVNDIISEAYRHAGKLLPISIVTLVWASSSATLALMRGLNDVYGENEKRNSLILFIQSVFYTLVIIFLMVLMMLFAFGGVLKTFLEEKFPWIAKFTEFWTKGRIVLVVIMVVMLFALLYTHIPSGRRIFFLQIPGALVTTLTWAGFSYFFAKYINSVNKYTLFYGSFGSIAIFLFWLYCCFFILLLGGFFNCMLENAWKRLLKKTKDLRAAKKAQKISSAEK